MIYRVVSVCGALGYGYPKESLTEALKGRIDAIISDGGSMDAGPYYLGTGAEYFGLIDLHDVRALPVAFSAGLHQP